MRRRLLALVGSLVLAGGIGLAVAPAASAEPSSGIVRYERVCYVSTPLMLQLGYPFVTCVLRIKG